MGDRVRPTFCAILLGLLPAVAGCSASCSCVETCMPLAYTFEDNGAQGFRCECRHPQPEADPLAGYQQALDTLGVVHDADGLP